MIRAAGYRCEPYPAHPVAPIAVLDMLMLHLARSRRGPSGFTVFNLATMTLAVPHRRLPRLSAATSRR